MDERLRALVPLIFRGGSDVQAAEAEIKGMLADPSSAQALGRIIADVNTDISTRKGAVTVLRIFMAENKSFVAEQGIAIFAELSRSCAADFQEVFELIAWQIVLTYARCGEQMRLLTEIGRLLASASPLPGAMLLCSLTEMHCKYWMDVVDNICPLFSMELELLKTQTSPLFMHYFASSVVEVLPIRAPSPDDGLTGQIAACMGAIMNVIVTGMPEMGNWDVTGDFLELAKVYMIRAPGAQPVEPFLQACIGLASKQPLTRKQKVPMFLAFHAIMMSETGPTRMAPFIGQVIQLLATAFELIPDDLENMSSDVELFIEEQFPAVGDIETPRAAARFCLGQVAERHPVIAVEMLRLVAANLGGDPNDVFKWLNFLSCASAQLPHDVPELGTLMGVILGFLNSGNVVLCCAGLRFLSSFPRTSGEAAGRFLPVTMSVMATGSVPEIVQYSSCCATGSLLAVTGKGVEVPDMLLDAVTKVMFGCSQKYHNDGIGEAVTSFMSVFSTKFGQFAAESTRFLVELFERHMTDENISVRMSAYRPVHAISVLCPHIRDPAVFDYLLSNVERFIEGGFCVSFCEELVEMVGSIVAGATVASPLMAAIPGYLENLYRLDGSTEVVAIANIFKEYAVKFGSVAGAAIVESIMSILSVLMDIVMEEDGEALVAFAQTLFVCLRRADLITHWIPYVAALEGEYVGDIAAALITCSPTIALQSEAVFTAWLQTSTPVPFLSSAVSALAEWSALPPSVQHIRDQLQVRIQTAMSNLDGDTESKLFNIEQIEQALKQ